VETSIHPVLKVELRTDVSGESFHEVRLKSSWTYLITPSRNFVEVQ